MGGEGAGGRRAAVFVAGDQMISGFQLGAQGLGFRSLAGLAGFGFEDFDRPQRQGAAGGGGPFGIVQGQGGLRGAAQPADR